MISGDKNFIAGHPRYDLQRSVVDTLEVLYWGRGNLFPKIPKRDFDIVTAQDPFWRGHLAAHLAWWYTSKLNLQVHTDLSVYSLPKRWWAGFNLRKATSVRVVSEKIKKQVEDLGVIAPIFVLPVFVDLERFRSVVPKQHPQKTILWIGRFEKEKDPLHAVSALKEIRHDGIDARLVMLGSGTLEQELRRAAEGLPVEFAGWRNSVEYLARADVVLSTSLHESWGASIVEALAAHVPVVAPDVGIAKEAGASVVSRPELAAAIVEVLKSGTRAELKLPLLTAEEWAKSWRETLV